MDVICPLRPGRSALSWMSGLPVRVVYAELTDSAALRPIVSEADYVIHVAGVTKAVKEADFILGNVQTTRALLEALHDSRSLRKFCLVSSLTAAGPSPGPHPIDESAPPHPITPYGASKLAAEQLCTAAKARIPHVIVRPPAVFGPRDRDVFHLFRWISFGLFPNTGAPNKELSVIHARDLARALFEVSVHPHSAGETYFVANERPYQLRHIVDVIAAAMNKRVLHVDVPRWAASVISALSQLAVLPFGKPAVLSFDKVKDLYEPRWTCSPAKIHREVGFRSELTLEEGVRDTLTWYRNKGWL